jgi:hypothetical protein
MLKLFDKKKRWALVTDRNHKSKELFISRNTGDGRSISIKQNTLGSKWMIVDMDELMLALLHVTHTADELTEMIGVDHE